MSNTEVLPAHRGFVPPKLPMPLDPDLAKHAEARAASIQNRIADVITRFAGSMAFVYFHIIWFAVWIIFGIEGYPYGLLTMIVSLEAIFLSTFVMISQIRLSKEADRRADLDLHVGLLGEAELTRVLRMLHAIQQKLGIECDDAEE